MVTKLGSGPKRIDDHLLNVDGTMKSKWIIESQSKIFIRLIFVINSKEYFYNVAKVLVWTL